MFLRKKKKNDFANLTFQDTNESTILIHNVVLKHKIDPTTICPTSDLIFLFSYRAVKFWVTFVTCTYEADFLTYCTEDKWMPHILRSIGYSVSTLSDCILWFILTAKQELGLYLREYLISMILFLINWKKSFWNHMSGDGAMPFNFIKKQYCMDTKLYKMITTTDFYW